MDFAARREKLRNLAAAIAARQEELASTIVRTLRKSLRVARGEVALALRRLDAFDLVAQRLAGRAPVGTVAVALPGNAALSNPVSTLGTGFLAGNAVIARLPGGSRAWAETLEPLFTEHLPGVRFDRRPGHDFLPAMLADPEVAVIMVFGDDAWLASYEEQVRAAGKKLIFEGPGKDPFLVLPGADLDLDRAARDAVRGAYWDAGQACTSPERFYVHEDLHDEFVLRVVALTSQEVLGEPEREEVTIGPIARAAIARRIASQLAQAVAAGARVVAGGGITAGQLQDGTPVTYVQPTVLVGARPEMAILKDETFGPILPIQKVADAEEALRLAADNRYGLTASLYGGTDGHAALLAESHGQVFRDEIWISYYGRNLHAPYGGRKLSGWVWEWVDGRFVRREGPRTNAFEFSRPHPSTP
jgi:succinate-semialdehyde dehydrogenase/glutarate-semialdehyde dehydrogenase